jgi:hypothetical protein
MDNITKVKVALNSGVVVPVAATDGSALTLNDGATELMILNAGAQIIATFSKSSIAYWTTDLASIT